MSWIKCESSSTAATRLFPVLQAASAQVGQQAVQRMALEESASQRAGGETILAKLSELMFVHALRHHLDSLPPESQGWLSGLRDAHIGKALVLIHGRPAEA